MNTRPSDEYGFDNPQGNELEYQYEDLDRSESAAQYLDELPVDRYWEENFGAPKEDEYYD
jgi:hypothetical protein